MAAIDERRLIRIAPCFGIEVQAQHEIGLDRLVHALGARVDFRRAVKQAFGEFALGDG